MFIICKCAIAISIKLFHSHHHILILMWNLIGINAKVFRLYLSEKLDCFRLINLCHFFLLVADNVRPFQKWRIEIATAFKYSRR